MAQEKKKPNNGYLKETPIEEIAQALGVSCTRVYQIEATAIRKIREGLEAREYGEEIIDLPGWLISYWLEIFLKPPETPK